MTPVPGDATIFQERETYSRIRLNELAARLATAPQVKSVSDFTIFAAGSYARHEASEHSDIDLFFLYEKEPSDDDEPRTAELRLFGALIEITDNMGFPRFSNDCQYLSTLSSPQILEHLGSPEDDYRNLFTVRMLMLLESRCLYGEEAYKRILHRIINAYYRDYPDHQATFEPWFLLNDIGRFWKTLLLNYEHKRNQNETTPDIDRTKQKVRNFKLKFSRMTTCFATVAALGSYASPVKEEQVFDLIQMTPRERLQHVATLRPDTISAVNNVLEAYAWFLGQTGLSEVDLYKQFEDNSKRAAMFDRANRYGDRMFELLAAIDSTPAGQPTRFLRYLVI